MPKPQDDVCREWAQARVDEFRTVDNAKPDDFTQTAWRALCAHYGIKAKRLAKVNTLEEALKRVAELAES